jgi:hypothetical protein
MVPDWISGTKTGTETDAVLAAFVTPERTLLAVMDGSVTGRMGFLFVKLS